MQGGILKNFYPAKTALISAMISVDEFVKKIFSTEADDSEECNILGVLECVARDVSMQRCVRAGRCAIATHHH